MVEEGGRSQGGLGDVPGAHVPLGFLDAGGWVGQSRRGEGGGDFETFSL